MIAKLILYSLFYTKSQKACAHCLGYQKNKTSKLHLVVMEEKHIVVFLFVGPAMENISFLRIPKEKCRQDSCLGAINRYVDEERKWRENSMTTK